MDGRNDNRGITTKASTTRIAIGSCSIDSELTSEPERIRDGYQVKAKRIEPVGFVYLWPVTG